jgi:hypothetical protein
MTSNPDFGWNSSDHIVECEINFDMNYLKCVNINAHLGMERTVVIESRSERWKKLSDKLTMKDKKKKV